MDRQEIDDLLFFALTVEEYRHEKYDKLPEYDIDEKSMSDIVTFLVMSELKNN